MGKILLYGTLSSAVGEPIVEASEVGGLEEALKPTSLKWMELKRLKDAKKLSPGHNYIITDYCLDKTRVDVGIQGYKRAGFSIMITALTTDSFSEDAKALPKENDTYYTSNNLSAWKIKYCFDNDESRFQWADVYYDAVIDGEKYSYAPEHNTTLDGVFYYAFAKGNSIVYSLERYPTEKDKAYFLEEDYFYGDSMASYNNFQENTTGGTGVIYYMKDEFGNEAPYDFKGIRFLRIKQNPLDPDTLHEEEFTFTYLPDYTDCSLTGKCFNNVIRPYVENGQQKLNHIVFEMDGLFPNGSCNVFEDNCYDMLIGGNCSYNKFGAGSHDIVLAASNAKNTFEQNVSNITTAAGCERNKFSTWCDNISLGVNCSDNIFSNGCYELALGNGSSMNVFGIMCHSITLGRHCKLNRFEDNVSDVKFIYPSEDGLEIFTADYCCCNHFETNTSGLYFAYTYESRPTAESWLQNVYVVGVNYGLVTVEVTTGYKDTIKISPNNNNNNNNNITANGYVYVDYGTSAPVPRRLDPSEEEMILVNDGRGRTLWLNINNIIPEIPDIPTEVMSVLNDLNLSHLEFFKGFISDVETQQMSCVGIKGFEGVYFHQNLNAFVAKYGDGYYINWMNAESCREDFQDESFTVLLTKVYYNVSDGQRYIAEIDPSGKYKQLPVIS